VSAEKVFLQDEVAKYVREIPDLSIPPYPTNTSGTCLDNTSIRLDHLPIPCLGRNDTEVYTSHGKEKMPEHTHLNNLC
jgi:hypothetical protein